MADPVGSLVVRIGGDATDLIDTFKRAGTATEKFSAQVESGVKVLKAFASAWVIREAAQFITTIAEAQDQLGKMAEKTGISVEALSELKYAASLSNVSLEGLGTGLKQLALHMSQAQSGGREAAQAFEALGVEVSEAGGGLKPTQEVLLAVADRFAGMQDGAGKAALAMKLFGKAGADLIPLLNQGSQGLRENADEARKLGLVFSTEAAKAAAEFNDNMTRVQQASGALARELAGPLIKALSDSAAEFIKAKKEGEGFFSAMYTAAQMLLTGSDAMKWSKEYTHAVDEMVDAEKRLTEARARPKILDPFGEGVKAAEQRVAAAKAEIARLTAIKPVMAPDAPKPEDKPKTAAPDLTDRSLTVDQAKAIAEAEQAAAKESQEAWEAYYAMLRKVGSDTTSELLINAQGQIEGIKQVTRESAEYFKQAEDERLKVLMDAEDARQEAAIKEGAETIAADGAGHAAKLDLLRISLATAEELENEAHEKKMKQLEEFTDAELEALGGRQAVERQMEQEHQDRLLQIRSGGLKTLAAFQKASFIQQTQTIFGELANITAGVAQHNRALFEMNKVSGIANAIVNAYVGISKTLATYPFPINIAMAAAHGLAAFAQVQAIQSASFGGGGAAPSLAGSTAATPVSPVSGGAAGGDGGVVNIHLVGDSFGQKQIRELVAAINENNRNGGRLALAG